MQGIGQVTAQAVGLHPGLAVRCHFVGVVDAQAKGLVTVVDDEDARVGCRDRLRARPRWARQQLAACDFQYRIEQVGCRLARRRVDGVAEAVRRGRESPRIGNAIGACTHIHAGFIGVLEVAELKEELTEAVVLVVTVVVAGRYHRLPGCRAAVLAPTAIVQRLAGLGVVPAGTCRFGQHGGIQADLLVSRWAEVVVGKNVAKATVDVVHVHHRVSEPALQCGPCAEPVAAVELAEVRMRLGHGTIPSAFTGVTLLATVEAANGMDALHHRGG
ncbi:hypothetical protein D9M71_480540 [compost metagenome]